MYCTIWYLTVDTNVVNLAKVQCKCSKLENTKFQMFANSNSSAWFTNLQHPLIIKRQICDTLFLNALEPKVLFVNYVVDDCYLVNNCQNHVISQKSRLPNSIFEKIKMFGSHSSIQQMDQLKEGMATNKNHKLLK